MFNKEVKIYTNEKDQFTVRKIVGEYSDRKGMIMETKKNTVMIALLCSIFDIKKLEHDIKTLNLAGIEAEIHVCK